MTSISYLRGAKCESPHYGIVLGLVVELNNLVILVYMIRPAQKKGDISWIPAYSRIQCVSFNKSLGRNLSLEEKKPAEELLDTLN